MPQSSSGFSEPHNSPLGLGDFHFSTWCGLLFYGAERVSRDSSGLTSAVLPQTSKQSGQEGWL